MQVDFSPLVSNTVWERDGMAFCGLTRTVAGAVSRVPRPAFAGTNVVPSRSDASMIGVGKSH